MEMDEMKKAWLKKAQAEGDKKLAPTKAWRLFDLWLHFYGWCHAATARAAYAIGAASQIRPNFRKIGDAEYVNKYCELLGLVRNESVRLQQAEQKLIELGFTWDNAKGYVKK